MYCIRNKEIIFGFFSRKEDRDYALRKFVNYGIPCEEKEWKDRQ